MAAQLLDHEVRYGLADSPGRGEGEVWIKKTEDFPFNVAWKSLFVAIIDSREGYTVKKRFAIFPSLAEVSLAKISLAGNNLIIPGQAELG